MNSAWLPILVGAIATLFLTEALETTQPKPCCTAKVYSTGLAMSYYGASSGFVIYEDGMYYYDANNTRIANNVTVTQSNTKTPPTQKYQIYDYVKKLGYLIINNQTCQVSRIAGDFPDNGCIPANATFKGTVKLGDSYSVNRWLFGRSAYGTIVRQETTTTSECVPVTSAMTILQGTPSNTMISTMAQEYFNFKPSIDDPDQKFTPPSICNNVPIADTENDYNNGSPTYFSSLLVAVVVILALSGWMMA